MSFNLKSFFGIRTSPILNQYANLSDEDMENYYWKLQEELEAQDKAEKEAEKQKETEALAKAIVAAQKAVEGEPPGALPKAAKVYLHTFDGKTTPVVLRPGVSVEVKVKGVTCALITLDPNPATEKEVAEAPVGKRVVEI